MGMASGDDGILYGLSGTSIFSVNTGTGVGTLVSDYNGQGIGDAYGTSFYTEAGALAGTIIVAKQTDPDGATENFEFSSSWGANFFLQDDQQNNSGSLAPGTYSVSEITPAGWSLTSATCRVLSSSPQARQSLAPLPTPSRTATAFQAALRQLTVAASASAVTPD